MWQLGNFVKDDVTYTLSPRDDSRSYADQSAARETSAGDDVIIGGDLYRVTAVDSRLEFTFDTTAGKLYYQTIVMLCRPSVVYL